jgi:hypothetical protein
MGNDLLTYAVMFDSLIAAYEQFLIMLSELQKVLSQDVCVARLPQSSWNGLYQKLWMGVSYISIALEKCKYMVQKCMYAI